jgi:hypothetical protein
MASNDTKLGIELENIWNEICSRSQLGILSPHLPSVTTPGVPLEIRAEDFPNTSLDRYRYTNLLS